MRLAGTSVLSSDRKVIDESANNFGVLRTTPIALRHIEMVVSMLISAIAEKYKMDITASEINRLNIHPATIPEIIVKPRMEIKKSSDATSNSPRSSMIAQVVLNTSAVEQDTIVIFVGAVIYLFDISFEFTKTLELSVTTAVCSSG